MKEIREFDEFNYYNWSVTTDLGSAWYDEDRYKIFIEGKATYNGKKKDVTVILDPEDTPEFNMNISVSEGEITDRDMDFEGELIKVEEVDSEKDLSEF